MSHYAYVNPYTNQVEKILVIDKNKIKSGLFGDPKNFVECSYSGKIRKVFPGMGYHYIPKSFGLGSKVNDVFVPPRPYMSWNFDEKTWSWVPPVPYPEDKRKYVWNELKKDWIPFVKTIQIPIRPDASYILNEHYQWEHWKSFIKRKFKENKIIKFIDKILF